MNKDFSKYKKIIDEFSGQVSQSDFEARYSAAARNIPKTERFLLKMELKRLAAPCSRLIDLRGHVDGECKAFEFEDKIHFLDTVAIRVFTETYALYGAYTLGVYEATMNTENNFRVIYQNEKTKVKVSQGPEDKKIFEKSQYPAVHYSFGPYYNRVEERMNFAISINVTVDKEHHFKCTSSDLSVNGCKFRVNGVKPIKKGQVVSLTFTGLLPEFDTSDDRELSYEIMNITTLENMQLVGLKRVIDIGNKHDAFAKFISGFIQHNKRRYKINLDNSIRALQSRTFEQFTLPKSNELPIFIAKDTTSLAPRYALTCNNNQSVYQYWQDEKYYSTLYCLITPERINRLLKLEKSGKSLLVFSFIHSSQGRTYFYTADEQQLNDDKSFMPKFLGFAASKQNFAITQLSLLPVMKDRAQAPFTLSTSAPKLNESLNGRISEEVDTILAALPYIVVATDITHKDAMQAYKAMPFEGINTVKLKNFGHKRLSKPYSVDEVGINYNNKRQELRFKYRTPVNIEANDMSWHGVSNNFSTSGLKVTLEKSSTLTKGDVVYLSFPKLQRITSSFELRSLPYEVMRLNSARTIINLRIYVEKHQHVGRKFFRALIDKNRDKLSPNEYAMSCPGLAKALRNIYCASAQIPSLIVQTSGSRYKTEVIAGGKADSRFMTAMKQLTDDGVNYNLYPILGHSGVMNSLSINLKKMQSNDNARTELAYIAINPSIEAVDKAVSTKLVSEFSDDHAKQLFIHQGLKQGKFFCVMLKLSRASEPDMDHLNPELSYISGYAIHRGKQLEQEIWSVAGITQVFDVTQEVLLRYYLNKDMM